MTKISKQIKDQNPSTYGYGSPLQIPGNEDGVIRTYYISFKDYDGDIRYCPVKKELYEWDRNEKRKEEQRIDRLSRCRIHSDKYGLKICDHDCNECPYKRVTRISSSVSMDYLYDNYEYEFADEQPSIIETLIKEELYRALDEAVSRLSKDDRTIVELFKNGKDDGQIAKIIGSKRSTVQYRRQRIFDSLKEQLKDF